MKRVALSGIMLCISVAVEAVGFDACNQVFYGKVAPVVTSTPLAAKNFPLCFDSFAVNYSGTSKTGLWSAEVITIESLQQGKNIPRENIFFEETRVPEAYRAKLADYKRSGFDRGHLAAAGNRISQKDKKDSHSLANVIPQSPYNNGEVWRNVEDAVRSYVSNTRQPAYVITGPLFLGKKLKTVGVGKVLVPTHVYKVVMFPRTGVVGAYTAINDDSGRIDVVSVNELQRFAAINFFPALTEQKALGFRYNLPLTRSEASRMRQISLAQSQTSEIFMAMPSAAFKNTSKYSYTEDSYQDNRQQAKQLGLGAANEALGTGIGIVRQILE